MAQNDEFSSISIFLLIFKDLSREDSNIAQIHKYADRILMWSPLQLIISIIFCIFLPL